MAQIKKDTSLRKAILQAAITGQLISDIGGESDVLFSNEKKSKTKLDSEADLPLASRVSKRNSVVSDSERTTPSPRGYAPKTPNEFASFENQNSVSERSERPTLPETGKELLDKIIEERNNKLLAEWEEKQTDLFASNDAHSKNAKTVRSEQIRLLKKAKKPAPVVASEIDEEEIPFEIPENWCWCRLGDIIDLLSGRDLEPSAYNSISKGIPYMTGASNFNNEELIVNRWTDKPATISNLGDLLITCKGTIGELAFNHVGDVHIARQIMAIRKTEYINLKFLKFFLMSRIDEIQKHAKSMIPGISREDMLGFEFPLPPLSVQNAIVAKLEQVLPLVDAYENAILQKEELKSALPDKVKKAILQEAITGQLTENWRKSATIKENGKQLLDRIIEERNAKALAEWEEALKKNVGGKATLPSFASKTRAKKPAPVVASEIGEDEIPFEIPESWCWCRIDDLFAHNSGKALNKSENKVGTELEYITTSNLYWNYFELDNLKTMLFKNEEIEKCTVKKGDLLVCEGGEVGRSAIWNYDRTVCIQNHIHRLRAYDSKLNVLFYYHVMYLFKESKVIDNYAKGIGIKGLSSNALGSIIVPLPPLEEQEEIVKKLEKLLPLCK